ncbi:hypothetical protein vBDshPR2C_47 [Dinoroseobacter phage vBDshPR2C]|uniref:Uncharacterized protein n=1 Tax=Dinoroseobacter phage vBDshPR2C TaxID=1498169 RepID=A0A0A7CHW8_9CAUD|nr:hypothetical protein vBDshPR2C_47 [Dinoroseobacter phage vBDshPR2C]
MSDDQILLPHWAKGLAHGDYTLPNAALPTRDGRATGNAVTVGGVTSLNPDPTFLVVTDAGNLIRCTLNEMKELFYPPEYVMEDLLPAHKEALLREHD